MHIKVAAHSLGTDYLSCRQLLQRCVRGLAAVSLASRQRVLNATAQLLTVFVVRDNVSEATKSLHWLPVLYRTRFKLYFLMYAVVNGQSHVYIDRRHYHSDFCTIRSRQPVLRHARTLRHSECYRAHTRSRLTMIPRTRTGFGGRAFFVVGPLEWNALQLEIEIITESRVSNVLLRLTFTTWFITRLI